jgi:AbrB family looped-hinge helix DNA binding protein
MVKAQKENLRSYGVGKVTDNGQITVPAEARADLGIDPNGHVVVFADHSCGRLIVLPWDPPADKLLEFATEHAPRPAATT